MYCQNSTRCIRGSCPGLEMKNDTSVYTWLDLYAIIYGKYFLIIFNCEKDFSAVATVTGSVINRSSAVTMSANPEDNDSFSTISMCASFVMLWSFAISACIDALKQIICIRNAGDRSSSYSCCRALALCSNYWSLLCTNP